MPVFELLAALTLCAATLYMLREGLTAPAGMRMTIAGFDRQSIGLGILAVGAAALFFGPLYGLSLILSVMIHEFGHVAAYRIAGHSDARFRLIPLLGGVAISSQAPATQEKDFFISLMGPGICLAPMALGFVLADLSGDVAPALADFLWIFASTTAVLNFFNLLPLWPLDGGRCVRLLVASVWPAGTRAATSLMSAAMAAMGVYLQSLILVGFALISLQSAGQADLLIRAQRPMGPMRALLAGGAYLFTAAAHFVGGAGLIWRLI